MMLTALNATDQTILDVTELDDEHLYMLNGKRVAKRHGYDVLCKGCHRPAHLVKNHRKTVFFRHDPGRENCVLNELRRSHGGESEEHLKGKATLKTAIESLTGWSTELEMFQEKDGDVVEVDVAATYAGTPRHGAQGNYAWEVQVSPQTTGEFHERTETIKQVTGYRVAWLTPFASTVGDCYAMICDPNVDHIVDRLLTSYEPEIASAPLPIAQVVRSVHKKHPGHLWFQRGDEYGGAFYVAHIDAFRTGPPQQRPNTQQYPEATTDPIDTPCSRPVELWKAALLELPYLNTTHVCAKCGEYVEHPWGFRLDPPFCKEHWHEWRATH